MQNLEVTGSGSGYEHGVDWFRFTQAGADHTPEALDAWRLFMEKGRCSPPVIRSDRVIPDSVVGAKETNPKDLVGSNKLPLHLWPTTATAMGCLGLLDGMGKYGRQNWRKHGVSAVVYLDACKRHLDAWFEGEDCAPDSGVPHLAHALACLAIIVDSQACGNLIDNRAYKGEGYAKLADELTPLVAALRARHADKEVHHFTIKDVE